MATFPERLKALREKKKVTNKNWTQKFVAEKIGVARETYTGYERGTKTPPIETINRIADVFEVTTDYLTGRSNDPRLTEIQDKEVDQKTESIKKKIDKLPKEQQERIWERVEAYVDGMTHADEDKN